ncbi:hypothetical protein TNCV_391361 [Trichonephila clavipes]|nr:hypothetical protein TNCV_391361 [Trichonephila clavipes]
MGTIGVKISSNLRAVCLEGPLKMIVCPKNFTPCEIAVCRSTINAGSDRWPVRLQTRVRWSLRLNRDSSLEDDTSPVCKLPRSAKSSRHCL